MNLFIDEVILVNSEEVVNGRNKVEKKDVDIDFTSEIEGIPDPTDIRQLVIKEVEKYLNAGFVDKKSFFNPLEWWKEHSCDYPLISRLVPKYLCLLASSLSSERLFSECFLVHTPRRSTLTPIHLEQLVFLHEYGKNNMISSLL
ncbi:hypothetical protein EIN_485250 [Entamoeba invadens IP1]|uniref:HAT C-terminal dimerisation domain-containing protein n=1 Tax=Entamoeba invadens IP1 TaxID=370355 RepID=A0A0A1UAD7_ENTIV|nr:hypothetical protein EIN_485250 [Entamoeba invadens IP1]ELP89153.1 hypothetical protein EIN_485250 [Entamoeba invadens IP1]|eukprot:XP_004255924.1 hypothetical protein EIN_485250 [Entamoeba invadens IP1]